MQQPNKPPLTVVFSSPSNYLLNADQVNTLRGKYRCTSIVHGWNPPLFPQRSIHG